MAGIDSFTKLMLHCDGSDASTTFTDSELGSAKTMTANGDAQIDTAQSKFGGASGLFDGTGDYLTSGTSSDYAFGTSDFTIDFWFRLNATTSGQTFICIQDTTNGVDMTFIGTTTIRVFIQGTSFDFTVSTLSTATWYHLELSRNGTNLRLFLNGTQQDTTKSSSGNVTNTSGIFIGNRSDLGSPFNGWLDEIRISKGIARHTANFTAETAAYSVDVFVPAFHRGNFMQPDCSRGIVM